MTITFHAVRISRDHSVLRRYEGAYEESICVGELMRNLCVNLCIDPDTVHGRTVNVDVHTVHGHGERRPFAHSPTMRIDRAFPGQQTVCLEILCLDN